MSLCEMWDMRYGFWRQMPEVIVFGSDINCVCFYTRKNKGPVLSIHINRYSDTKYTISNNQTNSNYREHIISSCDVFDLLTDEQKEYALFHLDLF